MPLRAARVGRVGVVGSPVARAAVVGAADHAGTLPRRQSRGGHALRSRQGRRRRIQRRFERSALRATSSKLGWKARSKPTARGCAGELHRVRDPDVGARRSETDHDLARFDDALAVSSGEAGDVGRDVDREVDGSRPAPVRPGEADETLHRPDDGGDRVVQIELDDLGAPPLACVADGEAEGRDAVGRRSSGPCIVGSLQSKSSTRCRDRRRTRRSGRCWTPRSSARAAPRGTWTAGCPDARDADRQPPARIDPAAEHAGERAGSLLAREERLHDRSGLRHGAAERVRPAGEQRDHGRCRRCEQGVEQLLLRAGQPQRLDVASLAAGAAAEEPGPVAERDDDDVGLASRHPPRRRDPGGLSAVDRRAGDDSRSRRRGTRRRGCRAAWAVRCRWAYSGCCTPTCAGKE